MILYRKKIIHVHQIKRMSVRVCVRDIINEKGTENFGNVAKVP